MKTVYDFTVKDRKGNDVSLSDYKGKLLLIVNTATGCGFTPHYGTTLSLRQVLRARVRPIPPLHWQFVLCATSRCAELF